MTKFTIIFTYLACFLYQSTLPTFWSSSTTKRLFLESNYFLHKRTRWWNNTLDIYKHKITVEERKDFIKKQHLAGMLVNDLHTMGHIIEDMEITISWNRSTAPQEYLTILERYYVTEKQLCNIGKKIDITVERQRHKELWIEGFLNFCFSCMKLKFTCRDNGINIYQQ